MVLGIPETTIRDATKAAMVTVDLRTINQLLLAQILQLSRIEEVGSLNEPCGCESPVRAADMLILNRCDGALFNPIDRGELRLRVVSLPSKLTQVLVISQKELSLGLSPV